MGSLKRPPGSPEGSCIPSIKPKFLEFRSSRRFITFVVAFACATDVFMYGLIVPVTPTALHDRLGLPHRNIQAWNSILLALFGGALLVTSLIVGYIADRSKSRRWPYLSGLVGLCLATALLCVGTNIAFWITGRLFQGAAAATVWVVGNALLADTVGRDGIGEVLGYTAMASSIGTVSGPLLGGVVYEKAGYYAVYGLAFAFIGFDIILRLALIEKKKAIKWLGTEITASSQTDGGKELAEQNMAEIASCAESSRSVENPPMAASVSDQQHILSQNVHSRARFGRTGILLGSPRVLVAVWGNLLISVILTSFDSVLPLFTQETFGWKQSGQGLIFIPLMIPHILSPITGAFVDKYPRASRYMTAGAFVSSVPAMVLLRLVTDNSLQQKVLLCALLSLIGVCVAVALPCLDAEVFRAVEEKERQTPGIFGKGGAVATAFGLTGVGFAAGTLVGPVFAGFVRIQAGWGAMCWALGIITGVSSLPTLFYMGGSILKTRNQESIPLA